MKIEKIEQPTDAAVGLLLKVEAVRLLAHSRGDPVRSLEVIEALAGEVQAGLVDVAEMLRLSTASK